MERLTSDRDYCDTYCENDKNCCPTYKHCINRQCYEKTKYYEELEQQGRLHITALSFGQKVYISEDNNKIGEYKIKEMSAKRGDVIYVSLSKDGCIKLFNENDIGKAVFITYEEA